MSANTVAVLYNRLCYYLSLTVKIAGPLKKLVYPAFKTWEPNQPGVFWKKAGSTKTDSLAIIRLFILVK